MKAAELTAVVAADVVELEVRKRKRREAGGGVHIPYMAVVLWDIDPRIPTMPGRSTSGYRTGRHHVHHVRSGGGWEEPNRQTSRAPRAKWRGWEEGRREATKL